MSTRGAQVRALHRVFEAPQDVDRVAFSPDSRILVAGSDDATARLWDVTTHQLLATLVGPHQRRERYASIRYGDNGDLTMETQGFVRIEDQLRDGTTPPRSPLDVTPIVGTWLATDENAEGIVKLVLSRVNDLFVVRAFGAARPEPIDWGESEATAYGSSVTATKAMAFTARFNFDFLVTDLAGYVKQGIVVLDTFNTFTDSSGRTNYFSREFFHR